MNENDDFQSDFMATPIFPESSMKQFPSAIGSILNNDNMPVTDDIINRQFPVKLENNAQICFFSSICQIFYGMPSFLLN